MDPRHQQGDGVGSPFSWANSVRHGGTAVPAPTAPRPLGHPPPPPTSHLGPAPPTLSVPTAAAARGAAADPSLHSGLGHATFGTGGAGTGFGFNATATPRDPDDPRNVVPDTPYGLPYNENWQPKPQSTDPQEHCAVRGVFAIVGGAVMGAGLGAFTQFFVMPDTFNTMTTRNWYKNFLKTVQRQSMSYARQFGMISGLFAGLECYIEQERGHHDIWNAVYSGCLAGAITGARGGPSAMFLGCAGFAAMAPVFEYLSGRTFSAGVPQGAHALSNRDANDAVAASALGCRTTQRGFTPFAAHYNELYSAAMQGRSASTSDNQLSISSCSSDSSCALSFPSYALLLRASAATVRRSFITNTDCLATAATLSTTVSGLRSPLPSAVLAQYCASVVSSPTLSESDSERESHSRLHSRPLATT